MLFKRIANSWGMTKASWTVLMENKKLLAFPILSLFGVILILSGLVLGLYLTDVFTDLTLTDNQTMIVGGVLFFLYYLISYVLVFYCNCALVGIVLMRIQGANPTLRDGFRIANNHLKVIFGYSMIAATVGVVLQWFRERGIIGEFVGGLIGVGWNLATFLIVPVLVSENLGPIDGLKRSAQLLKGTWGETIIGNTGIGLVFGALIAATVFGGVMFITVVPYQGSLVFYTVISAIVLIAVSLAMLSAALTSVYRAAIYEYATAGTVGTYFNEGQIKEAFRIK